MQYVIVCDEIILCVCSSINKAKNKIDEMVRVRLQLLKEKHPSRKFSLKIVEENECYKTIIYTKRCLTTRYESIYKIHEVPQF